MEDKKSQVVIMGCGDYDSELVYEKLKTAIDLLGGIEKFVNKDEKILIKPNLLRGKNLALAVTTHPSVFEAVIRILQEAGINKLGYGDSPGFGSPTGVARDSGLTAVAEKYKIAPKEFNHGESVDFYLGNVTKRFEIAQGVLESDGIISLSKMKTHGLTRITGAVKNQFGCVYGLNKGMSHARYPDANSFSKMLVDLNRYLNPKLRLFIMDGIIAMEGNGPASGEPVQMKVLLVSDDPVALDATFARMINLDPKFVPTIVYGEEMGLGNAAEEKIELLGYPIEEFFNPEFDVVRMPIDETITSKLASFSRITKSLLIQKPVVDKNKCVGCGVCEQSCPVEKKAIKMVQRKRRKYPLYFYNRCIRCYCCQEMCPVGAISVKTPILGKLVIYKK
ncbi:DUF362 domain-containing protein [Acetobacterium paludosum]|uniref:Ferredoxin n=1 Tax=Acetobacterium paludosum TaxID=52693 RepID=A0A923HW03_9FIRM|nr:DUF362 domain-containing protein [Acetobacterium paludosum]MBC3887619.1 DUF362 domain-containing protein [Acetobacterium paludosum]